MKASRRTQGEAVAQVRSALRIPRDFVPARYTARAPSSALGWYRALDVRLGLWHRIQTAWTDARCAGTDGSGDFVERYRDAIMVLMHDVRPINAMWLEYGEGDAARECRRPSVRAMPAKWLLLESLEARMADDRSSDGRTRDAHRGLSVDADIRPEDAFAAVDTRLPDATLRQHFAAWLVRQRKRQATRERPSNITPSLMGKWARYRLLGLADLALWAALFDGAWTPRQYQQLLFPTWAGEEGSRFRRTIYPMYEAFFSPATREGLFWLPATGWARPSGELVPPKRPARARGKRGGNQRIATRKKSDK